MNIFKLKLWYTLEKIMQKIVFLIAIIFHISIDEEKMVLFLQFIKFGMVGVLNTIISYVTYILVCLIGFNFHIANIVAFLVSVLNSFYWNNKYVFKTSGEEKRDLWKALIKTFISYGFTGLLLTEFLLIFWIHIFHISKYIAPLLNLMLTIPINFLLNKLWTFKSKK